MAELGTVGTSDYPTSIDTRKVFQNADVTIPASNKRWDANGCNSYGDAIIKIQTELGVSPSHNAADVATLLAGVQPKNALTASKPFQIIQTWDNAIVNFVGRSISITNTNSLGTSMVDKISVGGTQVFGVRVDGNVAFGSHDPKARIHGSGSTIFGSASSAIADGSLNNGNLNIWVDEGSNLLTFKVKKSGGTVVSGTVSLS